MEAWGWGGSFVAGLWRFGQRRGLGWVVEARVWVGVFSSPVREYQSKMMKLFYIISCFVCLIRCFKKTTFSLFNLLIGYLLLIRWQCE
jgi:hypothetical protein